MVDLARGLGPPLLAVITAVFIDRSIERRGLLPLRLRPPREGVAGPSPVWRRGAVRLVLFTVLWLIFSPLGRLGTTAGTEFSAPPIPALFLIHAILLLVLTAWFVISFVGHRDGRLVADSSPARQLGLRAPSIGRELALGVVCGAAAWVVVLTLLIGLGALVFELGGEGALPSEVPPVVPWMASLPLVLRLALSASAGFAEEIFFRGFLQPRAGIALSTALFAVAHLTYDQPAMLIGITLLSLLFAFMVRWRQNVWAAVVAHAVFDAIQLGFVIPMALRFVDSDASRLMAFAVW